MKKNTPVILLLALMCSSVASAAEVCLYSLDLVSPYSDVTARIELWGEEGSKVQDYVNSVFYAGEGELPNVVRIVSPSQVRIRWFLSANGGGESLSELYTRLSGAPGEFDGNEEVSTLLSLKFSSYSESFSATESAQNGTVSWNEGAFGVFWGEVEVSYNVTGMLFYDAANGHALDTVFGHPLASKKIRIQWIRGVTSDLSVSEPIIQGEHLVSSIRLPSGYDAVSSGIRSVNLWADGSFLSPDACSLSLSPDGNGLIAGECSWRYEAGRRYQLQIVDMFGNTESVWYPQSNGQ